MTILRGNMLDTISFVDRQLGDGYETTHIVGMIIPIVAAIALLAWFAKYSRPGCCSSGGSYQYAQA
eukprot:CAMPEP_0171521644 /NCGR_PEP_ID=MMETSP0959-20130129/7247_1 /TAXON_ID=87120 /ORGANISM="Aurantiochytrium limacinum, Strain ATCCMYA-1381" /LENGTH=65 /DNA_ID=CAMNT_0012061569 /DNA_START=23 /DNA_END=220 /DNA_ORIENTATION=+